MSLTIRLDKRLVCVAQLFLHIKSLQALLRSVLTAQTGAHGTENILASEVTLVNLAVYGDCWVY